MHRRLQSNANAGRMRTDVPVEVLHTFLETVMDGFISRMVSGASTENLTQVLDVVEDSVRNNRR